MRSDAQRIFGFSFCVVEKLTKSKIVKVKSFKITEFLILLGHPSEHSHDAWSLSKFIAFPPREKYNNLYGDFEQSMACSIQIEWKTDIRKLGFIIFGNNFRCEHIIFPASIKQGPSCHEAAPRLYCGVLSLSNNKNKDNSVYFQIEYLARYAV